MRHLIVATCLLVVAGCADTHTIIPNTTYGPTTLSANGKAYIALPADRYYGKIDYVGSGAMVARMLQGALLDHLPAGFHAERPHRASPLWINTPGQRRSKADNTCSMKSSYSLPRILG